MCLSYYFSYNLFCLIHFYIKDLQKWKKDSWQNHRHDRDWLSCEVNCSAHAMPRWKKCAVFVYSNCDEWMCLHTPLLGPHKYHSVRFAAHMAFRNMAQSLYHCKGLSFHILKREKVTLKAYTKRRIYNC